MRRLIVAGIDTGVGKTLVSAILTHCLHGHYWKPIESGCAVESDSATVAKWIGATNVHPPSYSLQAPLSPHHAAFLEQCEIDPQKVEPPTSTCPLIIEGVGGVLVPITPSIHTFDLFQTWEAEWIVVTRHHLGSINKTLLTLEFLKAAKVPLLGLIFNGRPCEQSEQAILKISQLPLLGRVQEVHRIDQPFIRRTATKWRKTFPFHLFSETKPTYGIPLPKQKQHQTPSRL